MEALDERGVPAALTTSTPNEVLQDVFFPVHRLHCSIDQLESVEELVNLACKLGATGIVFDHYGADPAYLRRVRAVFGDRLKLVTIGNSVPLIPELDLAIRQTIRRSQHENNKELVGPEYLLMRKSFRNRPKRTVNRNVTKLLVTLGGSESPYLQLTLNALRHLVGDRPLHVYVLSRSIDTRWLQNPIHEVTALGLVSDMVSLLESVDLAITACGTTLYQMAACGLPAIGIAIAENQCQQGLDFARAGLIEYLGTADSVTETDLIGAVAQLIQDVDRRQQMADQGQSLVDGCGAFRCADRLLSL